MGAGTDGPMEHVVGNQWGCRNVVAEQPAQARRCLFLVGESDHRFLIVSDDHVRIFIGQVAEPDLPPATDDLPARLRGDAAKRVFLRPSTRCQESGRLQSMPRMGWLRAPARSRSTCPGRWAFSAASPPGVALGLLEPPLALFIAAVPFVKMLSDQRAPTPMRFIGLLGEGAAKPVGSSGEGTVRLSQEPDK